jgi:putative Holliday junction resolvase
LIGLDLGTKTIGVAASDPDRRLATGVETVARKTFTADAARLLALAAERKAQASCSACPSTWTAAKARVRSRHVPLRAILRA